MTIIIDNLDAKKFREDGALRRNTLDAIQKEVETDLDLNAKIRKLISVGDLSDDALVTDIIYKENLTNLTADEQVKYKSVDFNTSVMFLLRICKGVISHFLEDTGAIARALSTTNERILSRITKMPKIQAITLNTGMFLELEPVQSAVYRDGEPVALGHEHDSDDAKTTVSRAAQLRSKGEALKQNAEQLSSVSNVQIAQMVIDRAAYADARARESSFGNDHDGEKLKDAKKMLAIGSQELAGASTEVAEMAQRFRERKAQEMAEQREWDAVNPLM